MKSKQGNGIWGLLGYSSALSSLVAIAAGLFPSGFSGC